MSMNGSYMCHFWARPVESSHTCTQCALPFLLAAIKLVSKATLETLPASVLWELTEEGPLPSCMSPSKAK